MRQPMRHVVFIALMLLSAPVAGQGQVRLQTPTAAPLQVERSAGEANAECTYDECALRLWNPDVLEGRSGERVARFGFFRPPQMRGLFETSDSASHYLDVVEENYGSGRVIWLAGQIVSVAGALLSFSSDSGTQTWGFAAQAVGFATGRLGSRRVARAREAMSRAVWWYNRDVVVGRSAR